LIDRLFTPAIVVLAAFAGTTVCAAQAPPAGSSSAVGSPSGTLRVCFLEDDAPRAQRSTGTGFDLAVMKAVAADAGVTLEPVWAPSRSGFSEVEATDLPLGRLARAECDAAASIPGEESLGRMRGQLALSRPYYGAAFEWVGASTPTPTLASLQGRRVGVQLQSFAHLVAQSLQLDWRVRPTPRETIELLDSGEVDAVLVWGPALAPLGREPRPDWTPPRALRWNEHVAVRQGSPWLAVIDRALERMEQDGTLARLTKEAGIPPRAPFVGTSDAGALAELRRELAAAR
jgi:ABC-type amino acid transport substrate-binding protein